MINEMWDVIYVLVHTPGVGLILGTIIATGTILGAGVGIAGFSWKEVGILVLAFVVYLALLELTRSEIFQSRGEAYTWLPAMTVLLTFGLYFIGFIAGYKITKKQQVMIENYTQSQLLRMIDDANNRTNA